MPARSLVRRNSRQIHGFLRGSVNALKGVDLTAPTTEELAYARQGRVTAIGC